MNNLIYDNYLYFKNNILPYYILIHTNSGVIIIDTLKNNLYHLLGIHKTPNLKYKKMTPSQFWRYLQENKNLSIYDLVDKTHFDNNTQSIDELHLYRRNIAFIFIFESLFHNPNLRFYLKKSNDFDSDYIQFCYYNKLGGYLGIIGSNNNIYHYFNSILLEYNHPEKYIGPKLIVKKVEKVKKESFDHTLYHIVLPKQFSKKQNKSQHKKNAKNSILSNRDINSINQLLKHNLKIKRGENGKKSIKIIKNQTILERGIKIDLNQLTNIKFIAEYINKIYGNK